MSEPLPKMICGSFQICGDTTETSSILDLITRDPKCRWARWITPISVILLVVSFLSQLIRLVTVNEPINDFLKVSYIHFYTVCQL